MTDAVKSGNARTQSSVATRANSHPNSRVARSPCLGWPMRSIIDAETVACISSASGRVLGYRARQLLEAHPYRPSLSRVRVDLPPSCSCVVVWLAEASSTASAWTSSSSVRRPLHTECQAHGNQRGVTRLSHRHHCAAEPPAEQQLFVSLVRAACELGRGAHNRSRPLGVPIGPQVQPTRTVSTQRFLVALS